MPRGMRSVSGSLASVRTLVASDDTERSDNTNTANIPLSTVSGISIPAGNKVRVTFMIRKAAIATAALIGFRINATIVLSTAAAATVAFGAGAAAQSGIVVIEFMVGEANYLQSGIVRAVLAETNYGNPLTYTTVGLAQTANIPTATITSLAVLGNSAAGGTVFSHHLKVYV